MNRLVANLWGNIVLLRKIEDLRIRCCEDSIVVDLEVFPRPTAQDQLSQIFGFVEHSAGDQVLAAARLCQDLGELFLCTKRQMVDEDDIRLKAPDHPSQDFLAKTHGRVLGK